MLAVPDDTLARGPWPVGGKTVKVGRLTVEVFYPAQPGSEAGKQADKYDMRQFLPKNEQTKIPDSDATFASADTYRDLPIDAGHGPYPAVIFVHGTASFRVGNLSSQALWASRGFVVMAADHPGLYLADYLGCGGQVAGAQNLSGDVDAELAALGGTGDLAFLAGHVDTMRIGLSGHSAGAVAVAQYSTKPGVQVVMPLAGTTAVARSSTLKSVLFVAGESDMVLPFGPGGSGLGTILYPGSDTDAFNGSPTGIKKRLVGIKNGGHLNVSDLCNKNAKGSSDLEVAQSHGVCGVANVIPLADCGTIDPAKGIAITNAATTAVLEETLQCQSRTDAITGLKSKYPDIDVFKSVTM